MKTASAADVIARIIRIVLIPPVLVTIFIILLYNSHREFFVYPESLAVSILTLGIVPVLAYAVWGIVPKFRQGGRDLQRKLAFVFTFIGYLAALLYGLIRGVPAELQLVFNAYFISAVVLAVINYVFKIKASGHSCSVTGPLVLCVYFLGFWTILPCLAVEGLCFWASLRTRRHTIPQLLLGMLTALCAFGISWLISIL